MHWERLSATRRVLSSEAARETHTKVKLEINSQVIKSPTNHTVLKKTQKISSQSLTRAGSHRKVRCGVLISHMADFSTNQYINQL